MVFLFTHVSDHPTIPKGCEAVYILDWIHNEVPQPARSIPITQQCSQNARVLRQHSWLVQFPLSHCGRDSE